MNNQSVVKIRSQIQIKEEKIKNQVLTHIIFRILLIAIMAVPLALSGLPSAKASTNDNTVIGWGLNSSGETGISSDLTNVIDIAAGGSFSLALKADGTVVGWGDNSLGQLDIPLGLTNVVDISAGLYHSLALKEDGTVIAWGNNFYNQISVPSDLTSVVAIAAGPLHSLALKNDGTVVGWGYNNQGQVNIPLDLTGAVAIAAGSYHGLALKSDGTIVAWGDNYSGQLEVPSGLAGVVAIDAGAIHSLALKNDGTIVAWGYNNYHQLDVPSGLTGVVAIAAGSYYNLALKSDGTIVAWGDNTNGETSIPSGLTGVTTIYAGYHHNLAIIPAEPPSNTAPTANPGGPYLGAVNTVISFDGSSSSDLDGDPLTYAWDFGDGATGTGATPTHTYTAAGVYNVSLTVNDGSLNSASATTMAVVYDPSAGFVTGGGWIDSPAGAYKADANLAGKASFGFMSKYQKGASLPTGTTAFQFDLAGLSFASTGYEWLVVDRAGMNAQFKGSGLINGAADPNGNPYKFMLWAADGSPDTFRIKIWWEDSAGAEQIAYDNGVAQAIGAGNIVVHTSK